MANQGKAGCGTFILGALIIGGIFGACQAITGNHDDADYIVAAHDAVQNELKSPSTASWCHNDSVKDDGQDDGGKIVTGCVNAQNSFGATVEVDYTVNEDKDTTVTDVNAQNRE